ncbi:MAG: sigma-70 family RNA polymerase sigma factor [Egibacteraceae bacterium]
MKTITNPVHSTAATTGYDELPADLLDLYFSELGKVRLLTADDEVRLAKSIETGQSARARLDEEAVDDDERRILERQVDDGRQAFDHFVAANLRLVVSVASSFTKRSRLPLEELIQEGNLGLIRAVEKFDWRRGYKFSTYATWWIRQAVQRGIAGSERTIRLPVGVHDALLKVRAARSRLESELGREPTTDELATATRLTADRVTRVLEHDHGMTSLDRPVGDDADASTLGELTAVATDAPDEEVVEQAFLGEVYTAARDQLDDRSWRVLVRRFGLEGGEPETLDAIGHDLGVSRETVRKIEGQALHRLRGQLTPG